MITSSVSGNTAPFRQAAVLGTGQMGPGIAAVVALGGTSVEIFGRKLDSARHGLRMARKGLLALEEAGIYPVDQINWAIEHIVDSTDFDKVVSGADLVIESTPEDMAFKQDLFCRMDAIANEGTLLASNTSGLSITAIASAAKRFPSRILTTHFWNPPHLMPLVEIVRGEQTSEAAAIRLRDFLRGAGKVPVIVKKDRPGQLGNRLQGALQREAMYIVQEGIADASDVDLAARTGFGLRLPAYGIFKHIDNAGLDLAYSGKPARSAGSHLGASGDPTRERRDAFLLDFLKRYNPGR